MDGPSTCHGTPLPQQGRCGHPTQGREREDTGHSWTKTSWLPGNWTTMSPRSTWRKEAFPMANRSSKSKAPTKDQSVPGPIGLVPTTPRGGPTIRVQKKGLANKHFLSIYWHGRLTPPISYKQWTMCSSYFNDDFFFGENKNPQCTKVQSTLRSPYKLWIYK